MALPHLKLSSHLRAGAPEEADGDVLGSAQSLIGQSRLALVPGGWSHQLPQSFVPPDVQLQGKHEAGRGASSSVDQGGLGGGGEDPVQAEKRSTSCGTCFSSFACSTQHVPGCHEGLAQIKCEEGLREEKTAAEVRPELTCSSSLASAGDANIAPMSCPTQAYSCSRSGYRSQPASCANPAGATWSSRQAAASAIGLIRCAKQTDEAAPQHA